MPSSLRASLAFVQKPHVVLEKMTTGWSAMTCSICVWTGVFSAMACAQAVAWGKILWSPKTYFRTLLLLQLSPWANGAQIIVPWACGADITVPWGRYGPCMPMLTIAPMGPMGVHKAQADGRRGAACGRRLAAAGGRRGGGGGGRDHRNTHRKKNPGRNYNHKEAETSVEICRNIVGSNGI